MKKCGTRLTSMLKAHYVSIDLILIRLSILSI
jgi:hypothetical protein